MDGQAANGKGNSSLASGLQMLAAHTVQVHYCSEEQMLLLQSQSQRLLLGGLESRQIPENQALSVQAPQRMLWRHWQGLCDHACFV